MKLMSKVVFNGLSSTEALARLKTNGYNELPSQKKRGILSTIWSVVTEPMLLLLISAGLVYLLIGDRNDALMLLGGALVIVGITLFQERKTENALEELKKLSNPKTYVIRNGVRQNIYSREVVVGDHILLREGDRVPADAMVMEQINLSADESILTGESFQVRKSASDKELEISKPGGDDLPFVFSGTMITQGRGIAQVVRTGVHTEIGKIGKSLSSIHDEDTLLKKETAKIVKAFALVGLSLCVLLALFIGVTRGDWTMALLSGLTLGMSMIPEEFSVVMLVFMTIGALRMSKRKVLTRHTASIETLGATNVLCVDKTGTLTMNRMKLTGLMTDGEFIKLSDKRKVNLNEKYHKLLEYSVLASHDDKFDPIEKEIFSRGIELFGSHDHIHETWELVKEYPLTGDLLAVSNVWKSRSMDHYVVATKGAPEAIIELCDLGATEKKSLHEMILEMSNNGLRIIGVAKAEYKKDELPSDQHKFKFRFIGFLGFIDPLRKSINDSIAECHRASIRVVMITGDYPGTATFIAKQIGLKNPDEYITGDELEKMNYQNLRERIKNVSVFARIVPEQKLIIVNAFKANGDVVAMTGDGVNDAPALKAAHVGIAMGKRGTDVARESADIVLLNDDFVSIVHAIRLGRRIFDNLRKSMSFIFSVHFPIAGMALIPILLNMPIVLLPAHIAFLELIIDPACSTIFEPVKEELDIMKRPPRSLKKALFDRATVIISSIEGISLLTIVFLVYIFAFINGHTEDQSRTMAFITIVLGDIFLITTNLSKTESVIKVLQKKNYAYYFIVSFTLLLLVIITTVPGPRELFHFAGLSPLSIAVSVGMALLGFFWFEGLKHIKNKNDA